MERNRTLNVSLTGVYSRGSAAGLHTDLYFEPFHALTCLQICLQLDFGVCGDVQRD